MKKTFFVGLLAALMLTWGPSVKADRGSVGSGDLDHHAGYKDGGDLSSLLSSHMNNGDNDVLRLMDFDKDYKGGKKGDKDGDKDGKKGDNGGGNGGNSVPAPEPGTLTMFGAGLLAVAAIGRRRFLKS
jgi:hypothetical protein